MSDEKPDKLDLDELAGIFRVTEKAVRGWIAAGMPVIERGTQGGDHKKTTLSLRECVEWYFAENFERLELDRARTRLADEQAKKSALENAETRSDLASISVMSQSFADAVVTAQALLLAIPTKEARTLAALTDANSIEHRLRIAINDALRQLAAYGSRGKKELRGGNGASNGAVRTAADSNGKRVGRGKPATQ